MLELPLLHPMEERRAVGQKDYPSPNLSPLVPRGEREKSKRSPDASSTRSALGLNL
jgi:hypothetical protein